NWAAEVARRIAPECMSSKGRKKRMRIPAMIKASKMTETNHSLLRNDWRIPHRARTRLAPLTSMINRYSSIFI
ncbi:MAG: hypothetical protein O2867_07430, partial [Bacteroidetes bacterium]|nr:hypothetical protein [Bacteroidota bacterium]